MPKRREVTPSGGSDRVREAGGPSESNKKGRWSAERHATVQGSPSPEQQYLAQMVSAALGENSHEHLIHDQQRLQEQPSSREIASGLSLEQDSVHETHIFSQEGRNVLNDALGLLQYSPQEIEQRLSRQDQQKNVAHGQHEVPSHQASASKVEQVDEVKCFQIVEQLINLSKRERMPRINEKESDKIIKILEEKKAKGEINNKKYDIYKKKIEQKIRDIKRYEENKNIKRVKNAGYYEEHKNSIRVKNAEYYVNNKDAMLVKKTEYYVNNKDAIRAKKSEYCENSKDAIRARKTKYYENNKDVILAKTAEKRVHFYQEALQKATNKIVALEQEITSLQQQPSLSPDNYQLLAEKQRLLREHNTSKKCSEKALARDLEKAQRLIQKQQELNELIGREAPSHMDLPESLPNAAEESSSHPAAQETRSFEERYHHWFAHPSHDAHTIDEAQKLYQEYHELQKHFEEDLEPLLADFWSQLPNHSAQQAP